MPGFGRPANAQTTRVSSLARAQKSGGFIVKKENLINVGDVFRVTYPFVLKEISLWDDEGLNKFKSWVPGIDYELVYPDESKPIAHGEGYMILEVISTHKPGKYPERVFFTRKYSDPDGKIFGKGNLHICSLQKFKRIASSYQFEYEIMPLVDGKKAEGIL
jgi:hypothetical protein